MRLAPKDPDTPATYSINWLGQLVQQEQRSTEYAQGAIVRPGRTSGFFYECTVAGLTSACYPIWPKSVGETVADGSVVWTTRHPDDVSAPTVDSAVWTVPSGITKDSQEETDTHTHITLSGGTAGEEYELTCLMTPSSGQAVEQSIVVPVAHQ